MRGEDKANALKEMDKAIITAIKEAAWGQLAELAAELRQAVLADAPSKADSNWLAPSVPLSLSATLPEKRVGWAVAEGYGPEADAAWMADIPTVNGLLGDKQAHSVDLAQWDGLALTFYAFKVNPSGEDICKALRDLIVHSVLYRAFTEQPRHFGYNTNQSPLLLQDLELRWELVAPKDMINPRKSEMRWGEKDTWGMQAVMKPLGVASFSLGRLQAEAEALQANISKENFSGHRARQWFENRVTVLIA
jgi:hypothetical protein